MKFKLFLLTYIFINFNCFSQNYGSFASGIKINNTIYNTTFSANVHQINPNPGALNFDGINLGSFGQNSVNNLITAAEIKTFKTVFGNVCSGALNWRVYPVGLPTGLYNSISLNTFTDCNLGNSLFNDNIGPCGNGDQKWKDYSLNTNFIHLLTAGNYTLEIFYSYTGSNVNINTCEETKFINNGGANFKANFTIYSPSSSPTALPNPICEGNTLNLTANPTGGIAPFTFVWTGPNSFTSILQNPTIPNISLLGAGVYSLVTTDSLGAISPSESTSPVVVTPRIFPTFETLILSYCRKVTPAVPPILPLLPTILPVQLPNTSTEGIDGAWSLNPLINDNPTALPVFVDTNPAFVGTIPPLSQTITYYFYPNASECGQNRSVVIEIRRNTLPTFGFPLVYCVGDIVPNLPLNSTNSVGGTWSNVLGAPITKINTNIIGLQQINFTPNSGLCALQVAIIVNIKPKLTPTFNLPSFVCINGVVPTLPSQSTNVPPIVGTWSPNVVSNTISQTYNFTATTALGVCSLPYSITINVNPIITPVTTFSYPTPICKNVANPSPSLSTGFTSGGTFTSTAGLVYISSSTGVINLNASSIGTYVVTYTITADPTNCLLGGSSTATIQILPEIIPVTVFTYNTPICKNSSPNPFPNLNTGFATGGTFSSTAGLVFVSNTTGEISLSGSTSGTYIVTYSILPNLATCQIAGTNTATITIIPEVIPVSNFTYTSPVCRTLTSTNYNPNLGIGFTLGGIFTSLPSGLILNPSNGVIDLTSPAGTYTVTYSIVANGTNCFTTNATSNAQITINPIIIPITGFSYTTPVCKNSIPNPSPILNAGFSSGGTFTSTSGLVFVSNTTGEINLAASTAGIYTITYNIAAIPANCQQASTNTAIIEIKDVIVPVSNFSYATPICKTNITVNPILGIGFTLGGTFTSTIGLTINASSGAINVGTSDTGTYTITYSIVANSTNCFTTNSTSTAQITINPSIVPVSNFTYTSPVCRTLNSTSYSPNLGAGFTLGGIFTSTTGLILNASSGVIDLSSPAGTYTVTYSIVANATNCFTTNSLFSTDITINPLIIPVTGFTYPTPVCENSTPNPSPTFNAGFTIGGIFSSTAGLVFVSNTTGEINLSLTTPGTYTITYNIVTIPSTCQLAGTNTAIIVIKPAIVPVSNFSYTSPVCRTQISTILNPNYGAGFTNGGTFTSTGALILNATTGAIDLTSPSGTYTVTYSIVANATNCFTTNSTSTAQITINPIIIPVTGFTYPTPVCQNSLINPTPTLAPGFTSGGIFSSTTGLSINATTGLISLTSTPGTYVVTYTTLANTNTSVCQLAGNTSFTITISPIITPVVNFNYNTPICKNATVNPSPILAPGFTTGGVFSSTANLTIDPVTGVITLSSSDVGIYVVTYTLLANPALCQLAGSTTTTITINTIIVPVPTFSYVTPVCKNAGTANIVQGAGFTFGGVFSSTLALTIDSLTGAINLSTSTAGTYIVNYNIVANATNCFSADSSSSTQITITPSTNSVTGFSYISPVCQNATNPSPNLNAGFTTGGTFSSTAGLSITATTGVIDLLLSTPGTYTITYTYLNNIVNCITNGTNTTTITINPNVNAVTGFNYSSPFCKNDANPSPVFVAGFTNGGIFSSTSGLVFVTGSNGVIDLQASIAGTYVINYAVLANTTTCLLAGNSSTTIIINPMVNSVTSFSYTSPICKDGINPSPNFVTGYTTGGTFSSTALLSINSSTGIIDLNNSTPGTYSVKYETPANLATCLLTGFSIATIIINANVNPVNNFSYTSPICKNSPNQSPILPNGFTTGGIFTSTSGLSINTNTGVINMVSSSPGTYIITYNTVANNATCLKSGTGTATITINPVGTAVTTFSYISPICKNDGTVSPNTSTAGFTTGGVYSSTTGLLINPSTGIVNLTNSTSGTYTITYTVNFNTTNCLAGSSTFNLTITEPIVPTFPAIVTSICKNELVVPILPTSNNGILGTWSPAIVTSNIVGNAVYTFSPSTGICATKPTIIITTFAPTLEPIFDNVNLSICFGGSIPTLPLTSENAITGTWSPSIVNQTNTGTYVFTPTLGICAKEKIITINYIPKILSEIKSECINANFTLTVNSLNNSFNPNNTYVWKDEAGVAIPNANSTSLNVTNYSESTIRIESLPMTYSVEITTPEGCKSSQTFKITDLYCEIQKGISPNGDGKNEFFDLTNFDVKVFSIFNRYGVKVYLKAGYKNEWTGQTDSGEILPDGTYFYNIEFANNETKTGWVYINKENK